MSKKKQKLSEKADGDPEKADPVFRLASSMRASAAAAPNTMNKRIVNGWSIIISFDPSCSLWLFSAMLHPRGRGSVETDWNWLGKILGALRIPLDSAITPLETTDPNAVFKFAWIEDDKGVRRAVNDEVAAVLAHHTDLSKWGL